MIQILSRKYFSEWGNGTTFASNLTDLASHLKGSAGERLKFVTRVKSSLISVATQSAPFTFVNGYKLQRSQGSWIEEGFQIGQSCTFIRDYLGAQTNNAASIEWSDTVVAISDSEIQFSSSATSVKGDKTDHALVCTDKFGALVYDFGFVENNQAADYISPYTEDKQSYYYGLIDTSTPTEHTMIVSGGASASNSWVSGDATVKYISSSNPFGFTSPTYDFEHEYEITQIFVINPFFIESFTDALDNGTQPDEYVGGNSLKHVCRYEFRTVMTNPNTQVIIEDTNHLGSVGWFNENYNGFNDIYSVLVNSYKDSSTLTVVDGLQLKRKTTVFGTVTGSGFANTDQAGAYFFFAAPLSSYGAKQDSLQDTFLWDSLIQSMTAGTVTGTGTERIKRFKLDYVNSTTLTFEIDIEFSSDEITYINPSLLNTVSDKYFIGLQLGNTNDVDTSNKAIIQVDWSEFVINNDVTGLATFTEQSFYDHGMNDTSLGHTDYKGWKQDGFLYSCSINLNKLLNANLKALQVRLVAYNTVTSDTFDLQSYPIDLGSMVSVNASTPYQKLSLDTTRGFRLADGDQFNQVYLFLYDPVSDVQEVQLKVGVKFDWQSWLRLDGADTIFYDASLDSDGLGKDASRYSMNSNHEIRLLVDADIKQESDIATRYTDMSPNLDIYGWGLDQVDPENWAATIQTFDLDGNDLGGAILENADTTFMITWTPLSGSTTGFDNQWAVHRIERENASSYNDIDELSSFRDARTGDLLKPSIGETYLKITDSGTDVITECLIDYTKLEGSYNISGRLGRFITYPRYNIARDVKRLSATELLMFNCPDTGIAVSNSLRIATLDSNGFIESEEAITLSASYTYQNWKMVVSTVLTNGKPNFYAVCFTGTSTDLYEFIYNGTIYIQSQIYSTNIGGDGLTCIRIDEALEPNSKPYLWFGNRDANIGGEKGFKHAYWDGAAWQFLDWKCFTTAGPSNDECNHPQDVIWDNFNMYVMNYDNPPQATQYNQGKIAVYTQTSGSVTTPADRANFANYTLINNIYRNSSDTENTDGVGSGDLSYSVGFERLEVDANSNPVFLIVHDVTLGTSGSRHFSRLFAHDATPTSPSDWTIKTPMAFTNLLYGSPQAQRGTANGTEQSSKLQRKNQCHIHIIDANSFITGHQGVPYWVTFNINDWDGVSLNEWFIFTPNDPSFDYTTGNILI